MDLTIERHALGKKIFPAVGDTAPPMGIRSNKERLNRALIVETVLGLQSGQSPRASEEVLLSYLPQSKRQDEEEIVGPGSESSA